MRQIMRPPSVPRLLVQAVASLPDRRPLCCGAAAAAARRRDLPRYRFELENHLMFGGVVRKTGRAATAATEPPPPSQMTIVSENGFLEGRVGKPVRSRSTSSSVRASAARASTVPAASALAAPSAAPAGVRSDVVHPRLGYLYPADGDGAEEETEPAARLPSVSRVLQATMSDDSRAALRRWEEMMVARHGPDGFAQLKEAMFSVGRELHEAIHSHLLGSGSDRPLSPAAAGFWRSVRPVLQHVDAAQLTAVELPLRHLQLGYQGVVDCVAPFRSSPMVIEWKTARRPKNSVQDLYDGPVQAAAYLGAFNYMHRKTQVERTAVVVAYESGRPATVHVLSPAACRHYWSVWLQRLLRYKHQLDEV